MQAAEEEAQEILAQARAQAEQTRNEAVAAVGAIHAEAGQVLATAQSEAERSWQTPRERANSELADAQQEAAACWRTRGRRSRRR